MRDEKNLLWAAGGIWFSLLILMPSVVLANPPRLLTTRTVPGGLVSVGVDDSLAPETHLRLRLRNSFSGVILESELSNDKITRFAAIPPSAPLGTYLVDLIEQLPKGRERAIPVNVGEGLLTLQATATPKIVRIHPELSFPSEGLVNLRLFGFNFGSRPDPVDATLVIDGEPIRPCTKTNLNDCATLVLTDEGRALVASFTGRRRSGSKDVQVRVGERLSNAVPVTFAAMPRFAIWLVAGIVALVTLFLLGLLVFLSQADHKDGRTTSSYSVSRMQIVAWITAAALVTTTKTAILSSISGNFATPLLGSRVITLIGISSLVTLSLVVIRRSGGTKGSGRGQRRLSDMFSVGGVVTPERILFCVVTALTLACFLGENLLKPLDSRRTVSADYVSIAAFVISAAAYVAGRALRAPGPFIDQAEVLPAEKALMIYGGGISTTANLAVNGDLLKALNCETQVKVDHERSGRLGRRSLSGSIRVVFKDGLPATPIVVKITNPDGQYALGHAHAAQTSLN